MDFNNFYISENGNECPLQVSYLLIYFTCDVHMTSLSYSWHWWAAILYLWLQYYIYGCKRLRGDWWGFEQLLIDDAVDQWPTRLRACVRANGRYFKHLVTVDLFSLYLMNFMFLTTIDGVHYKSMKYHVSFSQGIVSMLFRWGEHVFRVSLCRNVLPGYSSAKVIKFKRVFPELWSQMYCHVFLWITVHMLMFTYMMTMDNMCTYTVSQKRVPP